MAPKRQNKEKAALAGQRERAKGFKPVRNKIKEDILDKTHRRNSEREFLTAHDLEKIWTSERLITVLEHAEVVDPELNDNVITQARDDFKKILSVLLAFGWDDWPEFKRIFWDNCDEDGNRTRVDSNLPFAEEDLSKEDFLGKVDGSSFWTHQFKFNPIRIEEGQHNTLHPQMRMPFTNKDRVLIGKGGFGDVTRETIAIKQFRYETNSRNDMLLDVACKHFKYEGTFKMENANLATLRTNLSRNDRIASFMATLSIEDQTDQFYILSPLAATDLHKFLYKDTWKIFGPTIPDMADMILESSHLALALDFLHERVHIPVRGGPTQHLACCHMDLKPDNILVYRSPDHPVGIWKITDFGISTMKQNFSIQSKGKDRLDVPTTVGMIVQTTKTFAKRDPGTFQAPEVNDSIQKGINQVGRKSDIWSFGCILVLIFAFGLGGKEELKSLNISDYFYSKSEATSEYILHPHVEKFLKDLPNYSSQGSKDSIKVDYRTCQDVLRRILVVNKPDTRLQAEDIYKGLNHAFPLPPIFKSNSVGSMHESNRRRNSSGSTSTDADSSHYVSRQGPKSLRPGTRPTGLSELDERRQPNVVDSASRSPRKPAQAPANIPAVENLGLSSTRAGSSTPFIAVSPPGHAYPHSKPSNGSVSSLATIEERRESMAAVVGQEEDSKETPAIPPKRKVLPPQALQGLGQSQSSSLNQYIPPVSVPPTPPPEPVGPSSLMSSHRASARVPAVEKVSARYSELTTPRSVKGVFMSTSGDKIALLSETEVHVHFLGSNSLEIRVVNPAEIDNLKWKKAYLAGENLCLKGISGKRKNKVDVFTLHKIQINSQNRVSIKLVYKPTITNDFTSMTVSSQEKLLLDGNKGLRLGNTRLLVNNESIHDPVLQVSFGSSGNWCFVRTLGTGCQNVYVWEVDKTEDCTVHEHKIRNTDRNVDAIKRIIPFPKSRAYVFWERDDRFSIIRAPSDVQNRASKKVSDVKAAIVTPNEDMIIFIHNKSVSAARLGPKIGEIKMIHDLRYAYDEKDNSSAVGVQATSPRGVTIYIVHTSGKGEEICLE